MGATQLGGLGNAVLQDDPLAELTEIYLEAAKKDVANLERFIAPAIVDPALWTDTCQKMRLIAHNVKGQGTSFGYPLMTQIGDSLAILLKLDLNDESAQLCLVEAHVAALRLVLDQDVKGDGGAHGGLLTARLRGLVESLSNA